VQPYAPYAASRLGGEEMDEARMRMAHMLGVETDEVSFGPSTTANTYVLAQAFRQWLKPGDAIVVTDQDHEANSGPWRRLAEEGVEVRVWGIDPDTGHLDPGARLTARRGEAGLLSALLERGGRRSTRSRRSRRRPMRRGRWCASTA
jgi:selenocysteine lyase/cysteine desulfurase